MALFMPGSGLGLAISKVVSAVSNAAKNNSSSGGSTSGSSSGSSGGSSSSGGSASSPAASSGNGSYSQRYTGGNSSLDSALKSYGDQYAKAKAAGDAAGMRAANDAANQLRNQYGYAAEDASADIARTAGTLKTGTSGGSPYGGGSSGSYGGSATTPATDALGNMDYTTAWRNALARGASYEEMQKIYNARVNKTMDSSPENRYGQYYADPVQREMEAWLAANNPQPKVEDFSQYIEEMNRAQQEAALADLRAAYDKNLAGLNRTKESIAPQYQSARNQAAGQSALQQQAFNEYAAANGLNSGAGGQAQLAFRNALQNSLSTLDTQEASSLADLELQASQAEIDYNNAIAQAQADGNYQLAQQLYQEKVRVSEALREQMIWQAEQDFQQAQFDYQRQQQAWQNRYNSQAYQDSRTDTDWERNYAIAQQLAQYGDFSGYKALGIDTTKMEAAWKAQQALAAAQSYGSGSFRRSGSSRRSSSSSGSSGSGSGSQDYNELFKAAANSGHAKSFIANNYKKYGFTSSSGLYDDYQDWDGISGGSSRGSSSSSGGSGYGSAYENVLGRVQAMYKTGKYTTQQILKFLDEFNTAQLTDAGLSAIMKQFNLGGYR